MVMALGAFMFEVGAEWNMGRLWPFVSNPESQLATRQLASGQAGRLPLLLTYSSLTAWTIFS